MEEETNNKKGGLKSKKKGGKSRFRNFPRELREKEATIGRRKKQ